MSAGKYDFVLAIGGEAGQGIATPGDILARILVRRGLHLNTYNAYQSIIRGGHIFLTIRISDEELLSHGDKLDLLHCLNQDTIIYEPRYTQYPVHMTENLSLIQISEPTRHLYL